jgi:hypothetical protein
MAWNGIAGHKAMKQQTMEIASRSKQRKRHLFVLTPYRIQFKKLPRLYIFFYVFQFFPVLFTNWAACVVLAVFALVDVKYEAVLYIRFSSNASWATLYKIVVVLKKIKSAFWRYLSFNESSDVMIRRQDTQRGPADPGIGVPAIHDQKIPTSAELYAAAIGNDGICTPGSQNWNYLKKVKKLKFGTLSIILPVATLGLTINGDKSARGTWGCLLQFMVSPFLSFASFSNNGTDVKLNKTKCEYFSQIWKSYQQLFQMEHSCTSGRVSIKIYK